MEDRGSLPVCGSPSLISSGYSGLSLCVSQLLSNRLFFLESSFKITYLHIFKPHSTSVYSSFQFNKHSCPYPSQGVQGSGDTAPLILNPGTIWRRVLKHHGPVGSHWVWGWLGPRAGLDVLEKTKTSFLCRVSNTGLSTSQPTHYNDYATPAAACRNKRVILESLLLGCNVPC
jgi:hypothetical protein